MFSQWCCRNLGENLQHVYTNLRLLSLKQKTSEAQKPSLTNVKTSTIILVANVMIYPTETSRRDMAFQYRPGRIMKRCKIKNHETEFQMTESKNFWNNSKLLSTENENCYIGSVKREKSCLRRDCLKRIRCI